MDAIKYGISRAWQGKDIVAYWSGATFAQGELPKKEMKYYILDFVQDNNEPPLDFCAINDEVALEFVNAYYSGDYVVFEKVTTFREIERE